MRFGMCTGPDGIRNAADAGYDFVEMTCANLLPGQDEAAFAAVRQRLRSEPLPVEAFNVFLPGDLKVTGPVVDLKKVAAHMDVVLRRAAAAGASVMVFGSGGARRMPEGFDDRARAWAQLAEAARAAGEAAARYGMTIAMEPLLKRACNFFNRVEEGIALIDRVGHPNVKLLADLYHVAAEEEPFANVARAGSRLAHIHVATPSIPETAPGLAYDFPGYFRALREAGYEGRVSVEDNPGLFRQAARPPAEAYAAVLAHLRAAAATA